MSRRDNVLAALVATLWGLNFLAIDLGMGDVPPLVFLALRFVAVVLPAVFLVPRPQVSWRVLAAVGLFMSVGQFGFLYVAMGVGLPPGIAALVLQAQVVFTIVIAAGVLRERPTVTQGIGVGLGVVGLLVVALGRGGDVPLVGLGLCLMGALSWGIGNVVSRAAKVPGGLSLTVWSGLVVPVPVMALALVVDGPTAVLEGLAAGDGAAVLATLYTAGIASLLGYGIFNTLLARNPSAAVVPWVLLAPVVAMTAAWALLGDVPTAGEAGGGLLLVLGVLVALRPPRRAPGSAAALGVGRPLAGKGRERGADPTGGEVGTELVDLVEGAEAR
ncbi:MAG: EamA family transporter [Nocardioides sp.]|nr:EamA family transporter [Nocardioides sp.]